MVALRFPFDHGRCETRFTGEMFEVYAANGTTCVGAVVSGTTVHASMYEWVRGCQETDFGAFVCFAVGFVVFYARFDGGGVRCRGLWGGGGGCHVEVSEAGHGMDARLGDTGLEVGLVPGGGEAERYESFLVRPFCWAFSVDWWIASVSAMR